MTQPLNPEVVILNAALELPARERGAYLDRACGGNADLRRHVEALLKADDKAESFLHIPPAGLDFHRTFPVTEKAGDRIGRYKLLQQIGEGGCGVVYMAEQQEPVRRRVALKVIKLGMDTEAGHRPLRSRAPGAGADGPSQHRQSSRRGRDRNRPALLRHGTGARASRSPITATRTNSRPTSGSSLFIQVCQAIQHAHQKGIIHRDIKPSNILVTVNDGVPVPKVIDFGIAKATSGQQLTDKTLFTAFEQFIGTPAYMSPEQAVLTSLDIDTRSDIYALGVLLYELLTGKTPFDSKELLASGLDEMRRTIREQEPPRPSTRLSTLPDDELTHHRPTAGFGRAKARAPELRGDLDWIVMKALEKDRARRYETANGLAAGHPTALERRTGRWHVRPASSIGSRKWCGATSWRSPPRWLCSWRSYPAWWHQIGFSCAKKRPEVGRSRRKNKHGRLFAS